MHKTQNAYVFKILRTYNLRYIHTVGKICKAEQKSSERIKIIYFNSWRIILIFTMKKKSFQ